MTEAASILSCKLIDKDKALRQAHGEPVEPWAVSPGWLQSINNRIRDSGR